MIEDPVEDARIQAEAINRMRVFDAAPRWVRDQANRDGDFALVRWWRTVDPDDAEAILEGRPRPISEMSVFNRIFGR